MIVSYTNFVILNVDLYICKKCHSFENKKNNTEDIFLTKRVFNIILYFKYYILENGYPHTNTYEYYLIYPRLISLTRWNITAIIV